MPTSLRRVAALWSVSALLLGALALVARTDRPPTESSLRAEPVARVRGTGVLPSFAAEGSDLVRLLAGAFDPLEGEAPLPDSIPRVDPGDLRPGAPAYWLVQAEGADFAGATAAIGAAGGTVAGNVPDATYLVRATPAQRRVLDVSPAVRWSGLYQPGWKVPIAVAGFQGLLDLGGAQVLRVYAFRGDPAADGLADDLEAIPGIDLLAASGAVYEVRVGTVAGTVPAIAALSAVQWVEPKGELVPLNENGRWVTDTGVRDLYAATAAGRLTGAGQVAAVADTAVNYTTSSNGTASAYFSDCSATSCEVADYTQIAPGNSTGAVTGVQANTPAEDHRKVVAFFDIGATGPNPPDESSHGTHVSGSVNGDIGTPGTWDQSDGMAPGSRLVSQNISTPSGGLTSPTDDYDLWRQAYRPRNPAAVPQAYSPADYANYDATEDARTHNNSYGLIVPTVSLGSAEAADRFVFEHEDMVIISSAGNSGPDPASIGAPSIGRNVITSAASANGRQPMVSIDSLASFSSHGPDGNGAFGVDLATPGQIVVSAKGGTNDDEHYLQGTSMSGPILTGLATLVRQYFYDGYAAGVGPAGSRRASGFAVGARALSRRANPSAALVRATMVNGASRMRGIYTGDDGTQRALDGQYPSAGQGFGLVNLERSLFFDDAVGKSTRAAFYRDVYRADTDAFPLSVGGALAPVRSYVVHVEAGQPLEVTMAYSDAPTSLPAGTPSRVNDVDLTVVGPGGATYVGNNFNTRSPAAVGAAEHFTPNAVAPSDLVNPVEKVRVLAPVTGDYTIRVRGTTIAVANQGFALAASGDISAPGGLGFDPGDPLQVDAPGAPTIGDVEVTPVSGDLARVTFTTSEPTTAFAATTVGGSQVCFVDSYNLGNGGGLPCGLDYAGYFGLDEGPVETSSTYANRPVVQRSHEIVVTGLSPGQTYQLEVTAIGLGTPPDPGNRATTTVPLTTPSAVFAPDAPDIAQLAAAPTDVLDPEFGGGGSGFRTATQMYAGRLDASTGVLGAFMFRLPPSVDVSTIRGAAVELVSGHDLTNHYVDDINLFVDLLPESLEASWRSQNYATVHEPPPVARANARTGFRTGGNDTYQFSFSCGDLDRLKQSLTTLTDGTRNAAFRFDAATDDLSLFSTEFGFNRRSRGAQLRPRLVLFTDEGAGVTDPEPCDPGAPAPTITELGVQSDFTPTDANDPTGTAPDDTLAARAATVSWVTDVPSDSTVLYREKGATAFTQVGTPARSTAHNVQVFGLDPARDYEFAVRSTTCGGASTTDDNAGAGYDFFAPVAAAIPTDDFFFTGRPDDQAQKATFTPTATFSTMRPTGAAPILQEATAVAADDFAGNPLAAYWEGPFTGPLNGSLTLELFLSGAPGTRAIGVTVFGDAEVGSSAPERVVASGDVNVDVGAAPLRNVVTIPAVPGATVAERLLVQVVARFIDQTELVVAYGTDAAASGFRVPSQPPTAPTGSPGTTAGPQPPESAGATGLDVASVPTRGDATTADVAAGTARCGAAALGDGGGGGPGAVIPEAPVTLLLPGVALAVLAVEVRRRRRREVGLLPVA